MNTDLKKINIMCGQVRELSGGFLGGCDQPLNIMDVYTCVDCTVPFHRKCLLKHLKEDMEGISLTKMSLEDAFKIIDKFENK
jgi:hypothetical protein